MTDISSHAPDPSSVPLLFICGLHRSGTSALARLLATSPHVRGLSGTGVFEDEGQHLQPVLTTATAHGGPGLFAFDPGSHLTEQSPLADEQVARRVLDAWLPYWHLEEDESLAWGSRDDLVVVEKSPPNLVRTRLLQAAFPNARFLVLLRHPGVVTVSTGCWRPQLAAATLLRHWVCAHRRFEADVTSLRHVFRIRYEDLVADPAGSLEALGTELEVLGPFDAAGLEPGHNEQHLETWSQLVGTLAEEDLQSLEAEVLAYGYTLHPPFILPWGSRVR